MSKTKTNRRNKPAPEGYRNYDGKYVYDYSQPFLERNDRKSRITFNPKTGVGEFYYNFRTEFPVNTKETENRISNILKKAFNASRYICIVQGGNKVKNEPLFFTNIEFHFMTTDLPTGMLEIIEQLRPNLIPMVFLRTDKETGETKKIQYNELPANSKYLIVGYCDNPEPSESLNKKRTFDGAYWEYAK